MANKYKMLYQKSQLERLGLIERVNELSTNPHLDLGPTARAYNILLCAKDRAQCANRYVWKNLPVNITSQELETFFYNFGTLCFFVDRNTQNLVIAKYATSGTLNAMGRLSKIKPIDFAGKSYDVELNVLQPDGNVTQGVDVAVIINDYTASYQNVNEMARAWINANSTIKDQTTVYQQLINNVIVSGKKAIALASDEEQAAAVRMQANQLLTSARPVEVLSGKNAVSDLPLQMFNFANNFDCQNYCSQLDYYDKVRANFNGIATPPTAEKKEHLVNAEIDNVNKVSDIMLYDGLKCRQDGLELLKKYYPNRSDIQAITVEVNDYLTGGNEAESMDEEGDDYGKDNAVL